MGQTGGAPYSPLRGYLAILGRRKWYVVLALVLTPAVAVAYSLTQSNRYEATAKVLLSRNSFVGTLGGAASPEIYQDPNRLAQTQLEIARVPALAQRVLRKNGLDEAAVESFLDSSRVVAAPNADVLEFVVTDDAPAGARALATSYAVEFTTYRRELEAAAFSRAERDVRKRLAQLKASGDDDSRLYETLLEKREQLRTLATLGTSNAVLLRAADDAERVQPRPVRNGVLAGLLGLLLGVVVAGVLEALDTRTRSTDEISDALGVPLLGRIPETSSWRRRNHRIAMLGAPSGAEAEAFRILRANLDFLLRSTDRRTIMVTSALGHEGKSMTLSNLAVALALGGRHVVAVDLDLRRPSLGGLFGIESTPGASEVATGAAPLEAALVETPLRFESSRNGRPQPTGRLEILPAGVPPPNPGEVVGREGVRHLLSQLRSSADIVLIDTPPLLQVGDAATLSDAVDAVLVVVRRNVASRDELSEVGRTLTNTRATALGFVLTGSPAAEIPGYGSYYGN